MFKGDLAAEVLNQVVFDRCNGPDSEYRPTADARRPADNRFPGS